MSQLPPSSLPSAILFDLDGTLVDSLPDLAWAMNQLLVTLGRAPATLAAVRSWVGDGAGVLVERGLLASGGLPDQPLADIVKQFLAFYRGHAAVDSRVYPGVLKALTALKAAGHPLGVCTNKPTDLSRIVLRELGLDGLFSAVIGGDGVEKRKPHPEHVRATLASMQAEGRRALMIGDSRNDVAAAKAAGIPVVMVSFGYCQDAPAAMGADVVIDSFADLAEKAARFL
ncbi:phosphoglycolate phosphatase [Telmatospirillum sp.]|uniref:phosphoglycolate phosphatase n=1 Tax=Telmatospirillum sp. TaxID=2079197 RepID=UPI0028507FE6|nr:phosphoglycolate phosphatase [Telmatospirillum sp.]MDR3439306.1 phosphoglycolate phosphatase [Telmatospirillum sp.]